MIIFKNKILNIKVFSVKEAFKNYKIFIAVKMNLIKILIIKIRKLKIKKKRMFI